MAQTIEQTDKTWKSMQLIGCVLLLLGIGSCVMCNGAVGMGLFVLGGIVMFAARCGAWWENG